MLFILRILEILFYSLAAFVPWLFVTLYPFRNNLRLNSNLIALLAALMAAARIAVDMTTGLGIIENTIFLQLILLAVYILFCIASIRGPLVEMAVNLLVVVVLAFVTRTAVKNLELILTPSLQTATYSWAYTVILMALSGIIAVIYAFVYPSAKATLAKLCRIIAAAKARAKRAEEEKNAESTEETTQAPATKKHIESVPSFEVKEKQPEVAPVAAAEEKQPEPAPAAGEKNPESVPAAGEKNPEPVPAAEEKKPESVPAAGEKKPEPVPAAREKKPESVSAAGEKKPESVSAAAFKENEPMPLPVLEVAQEQPAPEESKHSIISTDQLLSMQYTNLNARILESRQLRGNVRRSIDAMAESLNSKNYDKLRAQMMALRQQCTTTSYSQDMVLSVTLDYYAQLCSNRGIHMNVNLLMLEDISSLINANDLIIVLGNLLDNALDACKLQRHADRHINVSGNLYGKTLRFVVENTYEQPVVQDKDGIYQSTKYDGPGAGLKMVQTIANNYNGDVKIDHTNGLFQVTVTLNI